MDPDSRLGSLKGSIPGDTAFLTRFMRMSAFVSKVHDAGGARFGRFADCWAPDVGSISEIKTPATSGSSSTIVVPAVARAQYKVVLRTKFVNASTWELLGRHGLLWLLPAER
jgi:hypothetical protein